MPKKWSDAGHLKTERLNQITKKVASAFPNPVSRSKTILWIEFNIGLSKEKANAYLDSVIETKGWIEENGMIKAETET